MMSSKDEDITPWCHSYFICTLQLMEPLNELTPEQYKVLREGGTEAPFSGKYNYSKETGIFSCSACNNPLFSSDNKFDSGTGWPSFDRPVSETSIITKQDDSQGMSRIEVTCGKCGSHLGHVFDDGPTETGKRYCINSVCLDLAEQAKK